MELLCNVRSVLELLVMQGRAIQLLESILGGLEELQVMLAAMRPPNYNLEAQGQEVAWLIADILTLVASIERQHDWTIRELRAAISDLDAASMRNIAQSLPHTG